MGCDLQLALPAGGDGDHLPGQEFAAGQKGALGGDEQVGPAAG